MSVSLFGALTDLPRHKARDAPLATTITALQTTSAIVGPMLNFSGQSGSRNSGGRCVSRYVASASADTPRTERPARSPTAVRAPRAASTRCRVLRSGCGGTSWDSRSESGVEEGLRDMLALMQTVPREVVTGGWMCVEFGTLAKDWKWAYIYVMREAGPVQCIQGRGKKTSRRYLRRKVERRSEDKEINTAKGNSSSRAQGPQISRGV